MMPCSFLMSIIRHGINCADTGALKRSSFEEAVAEQPLLDTNNLALV